VSAANEAWMPEDGWQEEPKAKPEPKAAKAAAAVELDAWASVGIKNLSAFDLPADFRQVVARIIMTMATGIDSGERLLPDGWGSGIGLEHWAREYCDADPQADLAVMYGLAGVATAVATQGGICCEVPITGGEVLRIPAISHLMVEADSGWRKSTALNAVKKPLERALAAGVMLREDEAGQRAWALIKAAESAGTGPNDTGDGKAGGKDKGGGGVGDVGAAAEFRRQALAVFRGGICPLTLVKDPTVEALRDMAVNNGGCVGVMSGEADVYTNLSLNGTSGSLTFLLDLWDQDSIETARVSGGAGGLRFMNAVALNMAVMFQTDVFARVTSLGGGREVDSFVSRGVFGRTWVVRGYSAGAHEQIAAMYADGASLSGGGGVGELTGLAAVTAGLEAVWTGLVDATNGYRAARGRLAARTELVTAGKNEVLVTRGQALAGVAADVQGPLPRVLTLDGAALSVYRAVQRMQSALAGAMAGADEDVVHLWQPMVSRLVQHVMREAMLVALAAGDWTISAAGIRDAACRVLPWRIGLQADALYRRNRDMVETAFERSVTRANPKGLDLNLAVRLKEALGDLALADPGRRAHGFGRPEVVNKARSKLHHDERKGAYTVLRDELDKLVAADPDVSTVKIGEDAVGNPVSGYVISLKAAGLYGKPPKPKAGAGGGGE